MSNIASAFANGKAYMPFFICGDPDLDTTAAAVRAAVKNGAAMIELNIPFSDPTAGDAAIQEANIRALSGGVTTDKIFDFIAGLRQDVTVPMLISGYANVVLSYVCVYKTSVLTADQKGYMLSKVSMVISLVSTAVRVLAIVLTRNYILYLVLGVVMSLSQNLLASRKAQKEYPYLRKRVELSRGERKGILKTIGSVFLYKLFSVLMNATDNLLTSVLVGTVVVGYYSNYHMLQDKLAVLYTLIFTSMTASVGNLIVTEKEEKRYEVFSCQQSVSFIICAIVVPCYVILINDFIRVWLGAEFVLGGATVAAIGLNMYLSCVLQPLWSYREATGLYRKTKYIMLLCAVLNLVLSVIFGMLWGLTGILFASNVARLLTYIWYEPKVLFREYFNRKPGRYFVSLAGNLLLIAVVSVAGLAVGALLPAPSFLLWFVKACCVGLCCLGIAILVYSRSSGVKLLVERAKSFLADRRRKNELEDDR